MEIYSPKAINELCRRHNFRNSRSLGQNFIADRNIIDKIIEGSGITEEDLVIEIGPGLGVLTRAAAERAKRVIAVEIDKRLLPLLSETLFGYDNIEILNADILEVDLNGIIAAARDEYGVKGVRIIGNLPYYITTPIIMSILESGADADSITVMMQKEVAERITSGCGKKTYGAISVCVRYYCDTEYLFTVGREVFIPQPKVDSAVLRLDLLREHPVEPVDEKLFFACIRAGFGQRRKTLLNSLSGIGGIEKDVLKSALSAAGIEPSRRAETLELSEFARLADMLAVAKGEICE